MSRPLIEKSRRLFHLPLLRRLLLIGTSIHTHVRMRAESRETTTEVANTAAVLVASTSHPTPLPGFRASYGPAGPPLAAPLVRATVPSMEKDGFQFGIGKEGTGFSIFLADRTKVCVCVCVRLCVCV
jgi:hypothetical protein